MSHCVNTFLSVGVSEWSGSSVRGTRGVEGRSGCVSVWVSHSPTDRRLDLKMCNLVS